MFSYRSLLAGTGIAAIILSAVLVIYLQPVDRDSDTAIEFIIEKGDSFKEIISKLEGEGLIKSLAWFRIYALLSGSAHRFKPGYYRISPAWNAAQISRLLVAGPPDIKIVVTEGETVKDVDDKLAQAGVISPGQLDKFLWKKLEPDYPFLKEAVSLEGLLFPDTYRFSPHSGAETVVRKFLENFQEQAWPNFSQSDDYYETLILASLVEKEAPSMEDRRIIAGIFYKRLKLGMPLQVDATVAYVKCQKRFTTCDSQTRRLSKNDLRLPSSFNTYLKQGLPPAPIANVSLDALRAVLFPQKTAYLYYLSDPETKKTFFATTLDEHNENRIKYLNK